MNLKHWLFALSAVLLYACAAPSHDHDDASEDLGMFSDPNVTSDSLHQLALEQMELANFNGAIAVYRDGEAIFENFYGVTNASGSDTLTRHSSFRLASLSKSYTCAGILRLCEMGKLDLDQWVNTYIPEFAYPEVTARSLMNHTSGVPDLYMDIAEANVDSLGPVLTIDEVVAMFGSGAFEAKPVGSEHAYSNSGYVLLAGLIQAVSGQSFEDFMQAELFTPLGMDDTRVWNLLSADNTFENKTTGFEWVGGERIAIDPMWIDGVAGDGAVFTSIADLAKWEKFWRESDLVSAELRSQAFATSNLVNGDLVEYGFGWDLGEGVQFHTGGWLGASTYILRIPEDNSMAVIYSNGGPEAMQVLVETLDKALGVDE